MGYSKRLPIQAADTVRSNAHWLALGVLAPRSVAIQPDIPAASQPGLTIANTWVAVNNHNRNGRFPIGNPPDPCKRGTVDAEHLGGVTIGTMNEDSNGLRFGSFSAPLGPEVLLALAVWRRACWDRDGRWEKVDNGHKREPERTIRFQKRADLQTDAQDFLDELGHRGDGLKTLGEFAFCLFDLCAERNRST